MFPSRRRKPSSRIRPFSNQRRHRQPYRPYLEALENRWTPATLMVTNTSDSGAGSLRQAILDSNASVGILDTIAFNIPGSGVQTIAPTSGLPAITDTVVIDGTTQPGYAGQPLIELDGGSAGSSADGLDINAGNTTIKGLTINGFSGHGISIVGCSNNVIQANNITGNNSDPFADGGILIDGSAGPCESNLIGGTAAGTGNTIDGNSNNSGIKILGSGAALNLVQGNSIMNNWIGVSITDASGNTVGGTAPGAGNTIWNNGYIGVFADTSLNAPKISQDDILSNSIFENAGNGLGGGIGGGINTDNRAPPTLDSALPANGGGTVIKGSLHSTPNTTFRIEFFSNSVADLSGYGQGQTFLGFQNVTTDGAGDVSFMVTFAVDLPVGTPVSATATGPNDNTSIFSRDTPFLVVINTNDSGPGSLRQAILDASANSAAMNFIDFFIPGSGVHTIVLDSALPAITAHTDMYGGRSPNAVIIDGTSQPGYAGMPLIELDGASAGQAGGLELERGSDGSAIKGLVINRLSGDGIGIFGSSNNLIEANFIGTNAAGTAALANGGNGIAIGGSAFPLPNYGGASVIGNVISGNQGSGITIAGLAAAAVQGNLIGTGVDGTTALGNGGNGVWISQGGFNLIGGTAAGAGNVIWFNGASGVLVDNVFGFVGIGHQGPSSRNGILSNSIFANGSLGITIQPGANNDQAAPTLSSAVPVGGGGTLIQGSLQSTANTTFRIEFFANTSPDPSGFGEGQIFLGFENVTTDGSGNVSFSATVPGSAIFGQAVSATATDPNNNTSQFSNDVTVPPTIWHDVMAGDFNGDGKQDIAGRSDIGDWWVALSTGSSATSQIWATWSTGVTWSDVQVGDFNGDGKSDIAGRASNGQWWVSLSTGSSFNSFLWDTWSTGATWVDVEVGDFNGDGKADITGRYKEGGVWWTAISTGSSFTTTPWATWSTGVTWVDVNVGDFNGAVNSVTGKRIMGLTARYLEGGTWWTAISTGSSFTTTKWATWSTGVTWVDVRVGDFNSDGKADITGRWLEGGEWWTAISTGSSFTSALWETWSTFATWVDVKVGDFNGDGKADITGRYKEGGVWWTAISTGSSFTAARWATWSTGVTWVDVLSADVNNDSLTDLVGRVSSIGQWWAAISTGSSFASQVWTNWPP